jgi:hypothetical protein
VSRGLWKVESKASSTTIEEVAGTLRAEVMETPWGNGDHSLQQERVDEFAMRRSGEVAMRGSLGQLIERSTSAPPPSSEPPARYRSKNDDDLVGNVSQDISVRRAESSDVTDYDH